MKAVTETRNGVEYIFTQEGDFIICKVKGEEVGRDHIKYWEGNQQMVINLTIAEHIDRTF